MPFYEYKCQGCGKEFEEFQSITDEELQICKLCQGKLVKLISHSTGNIIYKDSKELYERQIKPEAKAIAEKIRNGDEKAALDIFGEPE